MHNTQLVQAVWGGVLFGSVYGLMALGLTLAWGAVRLLNLAHGAIFIIGAYAAYWVVSTLHLTILVALPVGVLTAALFAALLHVLFIRPVIGKPGFDNATLVATVGLSIAVSAAALLIFNPEYKVVPPVVPGASIVAGVQITNQGLLVIAASLALFAVVYLFLTYTRQGMAIRAVSQQREAASLMSIPVVRTYGVVITISGALAGVAGVLLSPFFFLNPSSGFNPMIQALIVTIFGGLGSVRGALVAGYVLGLFESFVEVYFGVAWALPGVFLLIIVMLIVRPNGLFGVGEVRRL
ncbi:MAG TPA: branched-chain amino acid ABC transporter permease [Candidatus Dormibacteraeota bacterium]|nr:branched-chain amino acid ABC transporter permease [Candidatus Dormibacteraeota bacterium]